MRNAHLCQVLHPSLTTYFNNDPDLVAEFFDVSLPTARRWIATGDLPGPAKRLLSIVACGYLPCVGNWQGWRIYEGKLISPAGHEVTPQQMLGALYTAEYPEKLNLKRWMQMRQRERIKPPFLELVNR